MKTCTKCGENKRSEDFHRRSASHDGRQSLCKQCSTEHKRDWLKANRSRVAWNTLWTKYRVRESDFNAMMDRQGGKCPLCGVFFGEDVKPNVDHDHLTGRVRGLLCGKCNKLLGGYEYMVELGTVDKYLQQS